MTQPDSHTRKPPRPSLGASDSLFAAAIVLIVGFWIYTRAMPPDAEEQLHTPAMPAKIEDAAERRLYLEPEGLYTAADIEANGRMTASEKFARFRAQHDANPQPGDQLCPISQTKANPECDWVIGGQRYTFCCPPCIDEFLQTAKRRPELIQPPETYVR